MFEQLLARHDRATGAKRDRLALEVDRAAAQRYATVSRLYWYSDLDEAKARAKETDRPILALRMLGRLDEDLSCANSRLFRATLYANQRIAKLLRERFVLYWSSERDVPRVTIDFGDGRKIETTTTGNSAHYVLDPGGRVLDVLPGLYAPVAFEAELGKSLALARTVAKLAEPARTAAIANHHREIVAQRTAWQSKLRDVPYVAGGRRLLRDADIVSALERAQLATMAKARIEVPQLQTVGMPAGDVRDPARWAAIGQALYGVGGVKPRSLEPFTRANGPIEPVATPPAAPRLLDATSRALVARLHTASGQRATEAELDRVIERLEHHLMADTGLNQLELRPQISAYLAERADQIGGGPAGSIALDELNTWVYEHVFHTPRSDTWLGLLPRTDFTGVPGDGVAMP
jgi:hypothetical protein